MTETWQVSRVYSPATCQVFWLVVANHSFFCCVSMND